MSDASRSAITVVPEPPKWSPLCRCGREVDPENGPTVQVTEVMRRAVGEHGYKVVEQQTYARVFCSLVCAMRGIGEDLEHRDELGDTSDV